MSASSTPDTLTADLGQAADTGPSCTRLWRKVYWRTIPILAVAYLCSFIDRVNLGYVAAPLSRGLGLSATAMGFAAGISSSAISSWKSPATSSSTG